MGIKFLDEEQPQQQQGATTDASVPAATGIRFLDEPTTQNVTSSENTSILDALKRGVGLTARTGIQAATQIPLAVGDLMAHAQNAANAAMGRESRVVIPSESVKSQLTQAGLPEAKPGLETYASTGAEAMAGGLTKLPGNVSVAKTAVEEATRKATTRLGSNLVAQGVGAAVTQPVAEAVTQYSDNPLVGLAAGLATGTIVGSGAGKLSFNLAGPKNAPVSIEDVRKAASNSYRQMEDAGVSIRSQSIKDKLFKNIDNSLSELNFNPDIVSEHKPIAEQLKNAQTLLGKPFVSFVNIEQLRSEMSALSAGSGTTAKMAKTVVNNIDNFMSNLKGNDTLSLGGGTTKEALQNLRDARTGWRNQARAQVLQDILENAKLRAEGSFAQEGEKIQQGLLSLATKPEKMSMFSTTEQNIIKAASKTDDIEKSLMILGRLNPQRNPFQQSLSALSLYNYDTPQGQLGILGSGLGWTADKTLSALRERELKNIISQIASGNLEAPKQGFAIPGLFGAAVGGKESK